MSYTRPNITARLLRSPAGFTLVEMLGVMVIISILMAVAVPTYMSHKEGARLSVTHQNMKQISDLVELAREENDATLLQITGDPAGNSANSCARAGGLFKTGKVADAAWRGTACGTAWTNVIKKLAPYSSSEATVEKLFTDGWGRGILLDENEYDGVWGCTRNDYLYSGGPDGLMDFYRIDYRNPDKSLARPLGFSGLC